jgi:hypothetical protein
MMQVLSAKLIEQFQEFSTLQEMKGQNAKHP